VVRAAMKRVYWRNTMRLKILLFAPMIPWASAASAQSAVECITVVQIDDKQGLRSLCGQDVHVFWCHNDTTQARICGMEGKFFQYNTVITVGDTQTNPYSIPNGADIDFPACFGSWGSALSDGSAVLSCRLG
jgi:hypothetical protein